MWYDFAFQSKAVLWKRDIRDGGGITHNWRGGVQPPKTPLHTPLTGTVTGPKSAAEP